MVTDQQYRRLMRLAMTEKTMKIAASKAGMDEKTARKYLVGGKSPSQIAQAHEWRTLEGPAKEVFFPQEHYPGKLSASDFTSMKALGITIAGQYFNHLIYHFVLTYS